MSDCVSLFGVDSVNAFYSSKRKALVISAEVTIRPYFERVNICPNPLQSLLPAPRIPEYMVTATQRPVSGFHPNFVMKKEISASFPMDKAPAKVAVYSRGIDNPVRAEIAVGSEPAAKDDSTSAATAPSATPGLGGNKFTLSGDRTQITYYPTETPGPIKPGQQPGLFQYSGVEGEFTFSGQQIEVQTSTLGDLVTVILEPNPDIGVRTCTVLLSPVLGVSHDKPVTFVTIAIKATSRGFAAKPGIDQTYTVLPLLGNAEDAILPV